MKTLILNDSSWLHYGCRQVMRVLLRYFGEDSEVVGKDISNVNHSGYGLVVLNGEGTMHRNQSRANPLLELLFMAQRTAETRLINSVWYRMGSCYAHVLQGCKVVQVREVLSAREMYEGTGVKPEVVLDASMHQLIPKRTYATVDVRIGGSFYPPEKQLDRIIEQLSPLRPRRVDIFSTEWYDLVNQLRVTRILVTGRHHEMCAALVARCPVIPLRGNTHKT